MASRIISPGQSRTIHAVMPVGPGSSVLEFLGTDLGGDEVVKTPRSPALPVFLSRFGSETNLLNYFTTRRAFTISRAQCINESLV